MMLGWELPPHNSGGLGVACYQLCKWLASDSVDIEFVMPYRHDQSVEFMRITSATNLEPGKDLPFVGAYESNTYKLANLSGAPQPIQDLFGLETYYQKAIERIVPLRQFDVIHAHDWLTFRAGLRAKELTGAPLIVHFHATEFDRAGGNPGNPLVHEIEAETLQLADRVIAVSNHTKQVLIEGYNVPESTIEVVHNGLDTESLLDPVENSTLKYIDQLKADGYGVVVNVGRLTMHKGLANLLEAAKKVIDKQPKTVFLIGGDGEQYQELVERSADLGIAFNVIFTGFLRGSRWRDVFAQGDLFVLPSISEPFGLTPLEAAFYRMPSVVSKQAGIAEVFRSCLKVDHWDVDKMADQILSVLNHQGLHDELANNAFAELSSFKWQKPASNIKQIYDGVTA